MVVADAREPFDVVLVERAGDRRVAWSRHSSQVGAERLISSLTKAWHHRGDRVLDRWALEARPTDGGVLPAFATRAAAAAATDAVFWDATPAERARVAGAVVVCEPDPGRHGDPKAPARHVWLRVRPAEGPTVALHRFRGDRAGVSRFDLIQAGGTLSHRPYLGAIVDTLFSYTDGVAHVPASAWAELSAALEPHLGEPGTAWAVSADTLLDTVLGPIDVVDIEAILDRQVGERPKPEAGLDVDQVTSGSPVGEGTGVEPETAGFGVTPDRDTATVVAELAAQQVLEARQGASLERLAELEAKIARAYRGARAPATLDAYRSDFADFSAWCNGVGLDPLPAAPATVAGYLAELAEPADGQPANAVSTIQRRVASISEAHKAAGHPNPCTDPLVKQVLKGIRRQLGVKPANRKQGLTTDDICAIVDSLDTDRVIDLRDRALLLFGYATAMRRSELVALTIDDLEPHPEGLIVHKRRSKTDQEAAGEHVEVAHGDHRETCPVRALRAWIETAGVTDGPVFRSVDRHGRIGPRALSAKAVADVIKKHVTQLGYDPDQFAGHSLRRGFTTQAARNGAPDRTIARTTHHTNARSLKPYLEDPEPFTDPPSRYLGL